jgi:uncharacterized protein with von Willebrand factor type A (vWA) domain
MHFARVLRAAGLPIGRTASSTPCALEVAGLSGATTYWTLASVFLDRRSSSIYDQAFHIFWRDPQLLERVMAMFLPQVYGQRAERRARLRAVSPTRFIRNRKAQGGSVRSATEVEIDAT